MRKTKPRINITPKKLSNQSKAVSALQKKDELSKRASIGSTKNEEREDNFNNYILGKMKLK